MTKPGPFKVLVCDDQTSVRRLLMLLLTSIPDTVIVADVEDAETAWSVLVREPVDLVLLDLELPGRHGFALLERIMRECPVPVLIISGAAGKDQQLHDQAMALGAVGFVQKPDGVTTTHETLMKVLAGHIAALRSHSFGSRAVCATPPAKTAQSAPRTAGTMPVVGISSSTGGIIAVIEVLKRLPVGLAPVLITQHMLPGYADGFAARLSSATPHRVKVAREGDTLTANTVLVAPSGQHLVVRRDGGRWHAGLDARDKVSGHRPSCDMLFHSMAEVCAAHAIGVILTGMGRDGADGLLAMRQAGARTMAQDQASCVVFGMPRAALEIGAAERSVPLLEIGKEIEALLSRPVPERRQIPHRTNQITTPRLEAIP
ncbi:MAG: chemotaxis-specific protein-glutamate methyltransferase CheB [Bosea sp. (in: a-proteobacteria)]